MLPNGGHMFQMLANMFHEVWQVDYVDEVSQQLASTLPEKLVHVSVICSPRHRGYERVREALRGLQGLCVGRHRADAARAFLRTRPPPEGWMYMFCFARTRLKRTSENESWLSLWKA